MPTGVEVRPDQVDETTQALDEPYNVFLWNDPVTLMDVVVRALKKVFGYADDKAHLLMITAHLEGKAVVWSGDKERATDYCLQLGSHGLQSTVGRAG